MTLFFFQFRVNAISVHFCGRLTSGYVLVVFLVYVIVDLYDYITFYMIRGDWGDSHYDFS